MAIKNLTTALAKELQNPAFMPFLKEWIDSQIKAALENEDPDRIITLGKLRDLVNKAKG